jgi:hypothetical protein
MIIPRLLADTQLEPSQVYVTPCTTITWYTVLFPSSGVGDEPTGSTKDNNHA